MRAAVALQPGLGQGVPDVTDGDYEYITSEGLQHEDVHSLPAYLYDPRASAVHF